MSGQEIGRSWTIKVSDKDKFDTKPDELIISETYPCIFNPRYWNKKVKLTLTYLKNGRWFGKTVGTEIFIANSYDDVANKVNEMFKDYIQEYNLYVISRY
ncbi:MAG: hypothetical protein WC212_00330 [Candidatus Delongbacteria bacterium]